MVYLTAREIANKWEISSRMVAYYCESGRVDGAVKKGKTWFIPVDAEKPIDKRYSRKIINSKESSSFTDKFSVDECDADIISTVYHTKDIFEYLGLSRETLRYYEEIGLIKPQRNLYSNYREFDLYDMSRLMSIDFYKKRGFSPIEIKDLLLAEPEDYAGIIQGQLDSLQTQIDRLSRMQKRLKETKTFYENVSGKIGKFEVKELPLYYVEERIPSVASFEEYRNKVLCFLNLENEDILSSMVRAVTFDEKGYKDSEMYVVKSAVKAENGRQRAFLKHGKCLYTTLLADNNDTSIFKKMFPLCHQWAIQHQMVFYGVVYIFIRLAMLNEKSDKHFYEIWIPLK